ncbi:MAG: hypothetical protein QOJ27_277 [Sphingomonadales bacterium]|nr:hypothetical protein [Sphingomonadales bacterium]
MEAMSPVFAAFGVIESDALNDLAFWLDERGEARGEPSGWGGAPGDRTVRASGRSAGAEG